MILRNHVALERSIMLGGLRLLIWQGEFEYRQGEQLPEPSAELLLSEEQCERLLDDLLFASVKPRSARLPSRDDEVSYMKGLVEKLLPVALRLPQLIQTVEENPLKLE